MSPKLAPYKSRRFSGLLALGVLGLPSLALAQTTSKPSTGAAVQQKKAPPAPAAPQSKHYPILLIASGAEPAWSLRIGMKGAERLERPGYPPIPLDPGEIAQEGTTEAWLYHAKDSATQAEVTARVSREACTDGTSDTKYTFRVAATHAQLGQFQGCARIAPDQFPEFKQKNLDDDDPDKKKPPTVITFKAPTAVAYLDSSGKVMLARGEAAKLVAPKGSQLSLSHDGKRLLYTREDAGGEPTIVLYDAVAGKSTDLLHGGAQAAFWSPDDAQIAFLKQVGQAWHVWLMPSNAAAADKAAELASTPVVALQGWQDVHTVLATDSSRLYFLKTESPPLSVDLHDLYGSNFQIAASDTLRANPVNGDLLAVSAAGAGGTSNSVFLVEIKSKRRVPLTPPNIFANGAEWSRDGVQVFYNQRDAAKSLSVNRVFWDGSTPKRIRPGSGLVVGQ